jgi:hypothetical protein
VLQYQILYLLPFLNFVCFPTPALPEGEGAEMDMSL